MITIFYPKREPFFIPYYWHAPKIDVDYWSGAAAVEYSGQDFCKDYDYVRFDENDGFLGYFDPTPIYVWNKAASVRKFFENFAARYFELVTGADNGCKLRSEFRIHDDGEHQILKFHAVDRTAALIIAVKATNGDCGWLYEFKNGEKVGQVMAWGNEIFDGFDVLDPTQMP